MKTRQQYAFGKTECIVIICVLKWEDGPDSIRFGKLKNELGLPCWSSG